MPKGKDELFRCSFRTIVISELIQYHEEVLCVLGWQNRILRFCTPLICIASHPPNLTSMLPVGKFPSLDASTLKTAIKQVAQSGPARSDVQSRISRMRIKRNDNLLRLAWNGHCPYKLNIRVEHQRCEDY